MRLVSIASTPCSSHHHNGRREYSARSAIEQHMREEEDDLFPRLRAELSDAQNAHLTRQMNKEGLKLA